MQRAGKKEFLQVQCRNTVPCGRAASTQAYRSKEVIAWSLMSSIHTEGRHCESNLTTGREEIWLSYLCLRGQALLRRVPVASQENPLDVKVRSKPTDLFSYERPGLGFQ